MIIRRPSRLGFDSTLDTSSRALANFNNTNSPFSVYSISLPRNWTEAFTLSPLSKNSRACRVLNSKSWSSVLGRKRSSFTVTVCCFFFASFSFFFFSYWYLPKSIILQTGGRASGAISTKSRLNCSANCRARSEVVISWELSGLITRTCGSLISSFNRGRSSFTGPRKFRLAIVFLVV